MNRSALLPVALMFTAPAAVQAVNVVFTLTGTSAESVAGATINPGVPLTASQQAAGSMGPRTVSGSITVDVDNVLAPTTIQFVSANLDPADFGSNLQPGLGGTAGSAAAEFGFQFLIPPGAPEFVAWRNSATNLASAVIAVAGGNYPTSGITFSVTSGTVDFGGALNGTGTAAGLTATNSSAALGAYSVAGNTATLTLPNFDHTYITNFGGVPGTIRFTGSLTGTATVVPEPGALALMSAAALMLVRRRR